MMENEVPKVKSTKARAAAKPVAAKPKRVEAAPKKESAATEAAAPKRRGGQRELQGVVRSTKAAKSAIVEVSRHVLHRKYKKYLNQRVRYMAHDERGECREGDTVLIVSCRPLSRKKRWRVQRIVERQEQV
jgi:small subunit ribosomal protein S17